MTKRKGFTLIELLIVVVIIGVLSSMMSISSTSATDSAKASAIIGNLSTMKKAALADYIENGDANWTTAATVMGAIATYMGSVVDTADGSKIGNYSVKTDDSKSAWWITYTLQDDDSASVKAILAEKAKVAGLYGGAANDTTFTTNFAKTGDNYHAVVAMKIR